MSIQKIALIGAGGHGKVVAEMALVNGHIPCFFDERYPDHRVNGQYSVHGKLSEYIEEASLDYPAIVSVGDNAMRAELQSRCPFVAAPVIHPTATVSPSARIGAGTVIMAGVIINADAEIGCGVIINTGAVIEHDCKIGDFAHISPQVALAGGVSVGAFAWIGIGSCVRQLISIGDAAVIGAGSVVVKDIGSGDTAFGNPCKAR